MKKSVIIIGGGPAGLAAAVKLYDEGISDILIIEREKQLGGILRQCIHDGFGLTRFKETLSGPEYAQRFIDEVHKRNIAYITNATVIDVTDEKVVTTTSSQGVKQYHTNVIVLAMGCRERTRHALSIPGTRPAGIYTAGVAQAYMNLQNVMPGKEVIILGSGDIGMIMARRMTLEGAHVRGVFEILPHPSGLPRNIEQCLNDYEIPLYLSHTVVDIVGNSRLEGVTIAKVDETHTPIPGTEVTYSCDTLILSVGLIPENELSIAAGVNLDERTKGAKVDDNYQTNIKGIFAAGNVLHVHDLVDFVSMESERLAKSVTAYLEKENAYNDKIIIKTDANIGYTVPQCVSGEQDFMLSMRVRKPWKDCVIELHTEAGCVKRVKMKKALPAEMIQIPVKTESLKDTKQMEVKVLC